jgi:hypothetical protein
VRGERRHEEFGGRTLGHLIKDGALSDERPLVSLRVIASDSGYVHILGCVACDAHKEIISPWASGEDLVKEKPGNSEVSRSSHATPLSRVAQIRDAQSAQRFGGSSGGGLFCAVGRTPLGKG